MTEETMAADAEDPEASETSYEDTQAGGDATENEDTEGEGSEPPKPKSPSTNVQKRIDEITRARREAETKRDEALARVRELERTAARKDDPRPKATDFKDEYDGFDHAAYLDARQAWEEREAERTASHSQQNTQDQQREVPQDLREAAERIQDADPEAFDTLRSLPALSKELAIAVGGADDPGKFANWLVSNPDEAARLSGLSAIKVGREVAKIEVRLSQSEPLKKAVSNAPPPPKSVKQSGTGIKKTPDKESMAEYRARRNKELREKL